MKNTLIVTILCFASYFSFGQTDWPKEITPQVVQQIKASIEKQIPALKQRLLQQTMTAAQVEFAVDTFRIEQMVLERISIDYSTVGMNTSVDEKTSAYDKLLNKYYNKLLPLLQAEDKKILITAQKAWLAYRDAESKLIWTMAKDEYTGGGTMHTSIATERYSDLVVKRTIDIFNYYDGIVTNK